MKRNETKRNEKKGKEKKMNDDKVTGGSAEVRRYKIIIRAG